MADKIDPYDFLTKLILGIVLIASISVFFPSIVAMPGPKFPAAFSTLVLTALSLIAGELIQAFASSCEKTLFKTFGGKPSDKVFSQGIGDISISHAAAIKDKIKVKAGAASDDTQIFAYVRSMTNGTPRVDKFNALYGYFRGMLFLMVLLLILFIGSIFWGLAKTWTWSSCIFVIALFICLIMQVWRRTKQRADYYAKEVITVAEQIMDGNLKNTAFSTREDTPEAEPPARDDVQEEKQSEP